MASVSMHPRRVLVLCQRKHSTIDPYVQDTIVPQIEKYVHHFLGDSNSVVIEYLTNGTIKNKNFEANYKFALDKSKIASNFVQENRGKFSFVILNTCPAHLMEYRPIYDLLEPNGVLVFKSFSQTGNKSEVSPEHVFEYLEEHNKIDEVRELFTPVEGSEFGTCVFVKNTQGGRKKRRTKQKQRRKRKNRSRRISIV